MSSLTKITDVCEVRVGKTPSRANPSYWGQGSPWLSIADMNQGSVLETTKETITPSAIKECNCKIVPEDSVLMSFKLSIGKVGITKIPMYTNEAIAAFIIRYHSKLDTKFLFYALKSKDHSIGSNKAVMGKTLNKSQLEKIKISIPSVNEQKNIVRILDKADSLREKRKQSLALLDDYTRSLFLEMFGDPINNSMNWDKKPLSEFGQIITGNTPSRANDKNYSSRHIEWIKTDNIKEDELYITEATEFLSEEGLSNARYVLPGAVLIACIAGSASSIGRAAMTNRKVSFNQQINAIQLNDHVNPLFLYWLIKLSKSYILSHATSGMKKILTKGALQKVAMILPPIYMQNEFAQRAEMTEQVKRKMLTQARELETQFQALMQEVFVS